MSGAHSHGGRGGFIENTISGLHAAMDRALSADLYADASNSRNLLQRLDPRVKVAGLALWILAATLASRLWVIAAILLLAILLATLSNIPIAILATRVWLATFTLSATLAAPALFLTPGRILYEIPILHWFLTAQGLISAAFLVLRAETAATLSLLLVFSTPWNHVLKALRMFHVPVVAVVILGMTCRYILLLLETAHDMFDSRKSRTVGTLDRAGQRRMAILSTGVLLSRTFQLSGEVYLAMLSRGFRGEVYLLDDFRMTPRDWTALASFCFLAVTFTLLGR